MIERIGRGWNKNARTGSVISQACFEVLEQRQMLTANVAPVVDAINNVDVPAKKSLFVPLTATDADGDRLTYTVTSSNSAFKVVQHNRNPYIKLTVAGYGEMTFQLFRDLAPKTVDIITGLVQGEFYNGLTFHRISDLSGGSGTSRQWIIQGGDPSGDGTGGPPFRFDDEFDPTAIFSGTGQLAMANSGNDTNGSQFFITTAPTRHLDYNHTIFGQLVRGFNIATQLSQAATDWNGKPTTSVTITKAELVKDFTDNVLTITAPATGTSTITVTATDPSGNKSTRTFTARAITDTNPDEPPFFRPVPKNLTTPEATPISMVLKTYNADGDTVKFGGGFLNGQNAYPVLEQDWLTVVPYVGFKGPIQLNVTAYDTGDESSSGRQDAQIVTIAVGEQPMTSPTGLTIRPTAGVSKTFSVATFRHPDASRPASDFAATINWGDGQVSSGTITKDSRGNFIVKGANAYRAEGQYAVYVSITSRLGARQEVRGAALVADGALTTTPTTIYGYQNSALTSVTLGTLKDTDTRAGTADYTGTINWGDGSSSAATFVSTGSGTFNIQGTHTYANSGKFTITYAVNGVGGASVNGTSTAEIGRAGLAVNPGSATTIAEGSTLSRAGTITDTDTTNTHAYTAEVDYGDGSAKQTLTITDNAFTLNHLYPDSGSYKVRVFVKDGANGVNGTGNATFDVTVTNVAPSDISIAGPAVVVPGQLVKLRLSSTDISPADTKNGFRYTITWGDGSTPTSVTYGTRTVSHVYAAASATPITIQVMALDKDGGSRTETHALSVKSAVLQGNTSTGGKMDLVVAGTSANDIIQLQPAENGKIAVRIGGVLIDKFAPTGRIRVFGRAGNDTITINPAIAKSAEIYGEAGNDALVGGGRNDVVVGGAGDDSLWGSLGRDILIGGAGKDQIYGNDGEDVLVGASTRYDDNATALQALLAEWSRGLSYDQRVAHLGGAAGGLNAGYTLGTRNFIADSDSDTLTGNEGRDLFFARTSQSPTDTVNSDPDEDVRVI